ncbi:spore maturation protein CgeB [Evansella caseinilytica]|uniref:Spore maturation protein CgeB n=1 Tax=Evansella caseinilytica TaxID=1503961 RepID=A0A1H3HQX2_9BACI|nr:DUF3880 domain-containing protein [Evansella caseinilytica]SDY17154.1 spore maturation protein CgeB [Evansella caseinilytica]
MKFLYIRSSYGGIYHYFDEGIIRAFTAAGWTPVTLSANSTPEQIAVAISEEAPAFLFTLIGNGRSDKIIPALSSLPLPKAGWFCEDPYYIHDTVKIIDHFHAIFTVEKNAVHFYQQAGHQHVTYLPLGFDEKIYCPQKPEGSLYQADVCLVGYPYEERVELMKYLLKETSWNIQVIGGKWSYALHSIKNSRLQLINYWIPPEKVAYYYSTSKVVINTHRSLNETMNNNKAIRWRRRNGSTNRVSFSENRNNREADIHASSPNNRLFEIAGCKAAQVVDHTRNISRLFPSAGSIPVFHTEEECLQKIAVLLDDVKARKQLVAATYKDSLKLHTFTSRVRKLISVINKELLS